MNTLPNILMTPRELTLDETMTRLEKAMLKIADDRKALLGMLTEALEFIEECPDSSGNAMSLAQEIEAVLRKVAS